MGKRHSLERDTPGSGSAARVSIRIGKRIALDARVTSAGLLATGALVSAILLSTAVVVAQAERSRGARRLAARAPVGDTA